MSADDEFKKLQEKGAPKGTFVRRPTTFRRAVTRDGRDGTLKAEKGRFHLVVSMACPWACRCLAVRRLKGLEDAVAVTVVDPLMGERGWSFRPDRPFAPRPEFTHVSDVYYESDAAYDGRFTVPILYDTREHRIVNNESSEIIRLFNAEFGGLSATPEQAALDLYPEELRAEIDAVNEWVYPSINNGVYRAGFAGSQEAYDAAVAELRAGLDRAEALLKTRRYLCGGRLTEADVRLFVTLVRNDPVYAIHFKTSVVLPLHYPALAAFTRDIYQHPGVAETVDLDEIKLHYYASHVSINPRRTVAAGFDTGLDAPHGREALP